jgi:uncharacterized protein YqgV (UPF0045/DUF77 family)
MMMGVSVEMSMYPLLPDYKPLIVDFIQRLKSYPELKTISNNMSTRVFGDYDVVMPILMEAMKISLQRPETIVVVMKIIGKNLEE